jgi:hypothetical protein
MRMRGGRVLVVGAACLVWLSGCETSTKLTGLFSTQRSDPDTTASIADPADPSAEPLTTGSAATAPG